MPWIKNLTAVAWVAAEAQAPSPAPCSGLKDPALLLLLLLLLGGTQSLAQNFHMPRGDQLKKKKTERINEIHVQCCSKRCLLKNDSIRPPLLSSITEFQRRESPPLYAPGLWARKCFSVLSSLGHSFFFLVCQYIYSPNRQKNLQNFRIPRKAHAQCMLGHPTGKGASERLEDLGNPERQESTSGTLHSGRRLWEVLLWWVPQ